MEALKLKIERKETTVEEVELSIPCFFRNQAETEYVAALDAGTIVEIIDDQYERSLRNYSSTAWNVGRGRIEHAYQKFTSCTETEFLAKFDSVVESISLHPKLAV
jgi:hypothetical protein